MSAEGDTVDGSTTQVTVIICVYNGGDYLLTSVKSILTQSHRNIELIVVDDGSVDGCTDSIEAIDDSRLRVVYHEENRGKSVAMNTGIAASSGEFFAVQDADDVSHPSRIERQLAHMQANPDLAALFCGHELILGGERVAPRTRHLDRAACRRVIARMTLPALDPTAMYRRSLVREFAFDPNLRIGQGLDYILRIGEQHPIAVLGECLYSYRISKSSRTKRDASQRRNFVHSVCVSACARRGLPESYASRFYQDEETLGQNRVLDNNVAAHFMESSLDLRRGGHPYRATTTALRCSALQPLDFHYHKALLYSLLPLPLVDRLRRSRIDSAVAPLAVKTGTNGSAPSTNIVAVRENLVETPRPLRICLFGAAGDTGNLGVSALMHSALGGIARFAPDSHVTVFDNGWGMREAGAFVQGREFPYWRCGARLSRRYYRPESFANMRVSGALGGMANPGARAVIRADAVWDVSGGDSFGDIYGERHLRGILEPKRMALWHGRPLILLPQTYGPFHRSESREAAAKIVRASALAWARDERSFDAMKALIGDAFDPKRHRVGVDMAFALESYPPSTALTGQLADWMSSTDRPTIGINVSGLIYNDADASSKYGLSVDYGRLLRDLIARFLSETDVRIVLISHVIPTEVHVESDILAARALAEVVASSDRVAVLPDGFDQSETKWIISRLDWFCGTRMHACIGAMSSLVPVSGLAYSIKFRGVFEECGVGDHITDLRKSSNDAALREIWTSWEDRAAAKRSLMERIPSVRARAHEELLETIEFTVRSI